MTRQQAIYEEWTEEEWKVYKNNLIQNQEDLR